MQNAIAALERNLSSLDDRAKESYECLREVEATGERHRVALADLSNQRADVLQALDLLRAVSGLKPGPEKVVEHWEKPLGFTFGELGRVGQALGKMENPFTREAMDQAGTLRQGAQKHYTGSQDWPADGAAKVEDPSYNRDSEGSLRRGY